MIVGYSVFITPLLSLNTYGTEVDISDLIEDAGVNSLTRGIDAGDYDFGIYAFGDISITAINRDGYFNDQNDCRSIFKLKRDMAKVRIVFTNSQTADTITFRGLVNEEATRIDVANDSIQFRVLSQDSVLRSAIIPQGTIANGDTIQTAVNNILNLPAVSSILTTDVSNINPGNDFAIDVGSFFDYISVKDALDALLLASSSVLIIDVDGNVSVQDRTDNDSTSILMLYGKNDIFSRENIISLSNYNNGKHRQFTSVVINDVISTNDAFVEDFGFRQKTLTFDWITTAFTKQSIADDLLDNFDVAKTELQVEVATMLAKDFAILDRVSINYPLRVHANPGKFLPIVGVTQIGSAMEPLPNALGSTVILPNTKFKIVNIEENPSTFTTILKLRETGKDINDGVFNGFGNALIGFAIVGEAVVHSGRSDPTFNPSVLGAAVIGETLTA